MFMTFLDSNARPDVKPELEALDGGTTEVDEGLPLLGPKRFRWL